MSLLFEYCISSKKKLLLVAPGITTRNKKLLVTTGLGSEGGRNPGDGLIVLQYDPPPSPTAWQPTSRAMASNLGAMASNVRGMASNLLAMASNASNLL